MARRLGVAVFLVLAVLGCSGAQEVDNDNWKLMYRIYQDCSVRDGGVVPCLKMRALTFIDRVGRLDNIPIVDAVTLVRVAPNEGRALAESEIEASLPKDADQRDNSLSTMLLSRIAKFFRTHTLQVKLPEVSEGELARSFEEGRGKMKKMMGMMMVMGGAMKFGLLMLLKIKGLFFLAKKALIISKIALILALMMVFKKMMGGGAKSEHSGWSSGGGGGGGGWNRRAIESAHDLAFSAQKPTLS